MSDQPKSLFQQMNDLLQESNMSFYLKTKKTLVSMMKENAQNGISKTVYEVNRAISMPNLSNIRMQVFQDLVSKDSDFEGFDIKVTPARPKTESCYEFCITVEFKNNN